MAKKNRKTKTKVGLIIRLTIKPTSVVVLVTMAGLAAPIVGALGR